MKKYAVKAIKIILVVALVFILYNYKRYRNWVDREWKVDTPRYVMEEDPTANEEVDLRNLYKKINYEYVENNLGSEFKEVYYSNNKMDDKFYIYLGIIPLIEEEIKTNCNLNKVISGDKVDDMVQKLFGSIKYTKIGFEFRDKSVNVEYNNIENNFKIMTTKCSGVDYTKGGVRTEYIKATQGVSTALIEERIYYMKTLLNPNGMSYNYYSGHDEKSQYISNDFEKIDTNKLPTYQLLFSREGNNYYFRNIEKR